MFTYSYKYLTFNADNIDYSLPINLCYRTPSSNIIYSGKIPLEDSLAIRVSHQILKIPIADLCKKFDQYGRTSIYRHAKKKLYEKKTDLRRAAKDFVNT